MHIPVLIMLSGLPGCGKSTAARALQNALPQLNLAIVASDRVRKELFPNPTYSEQENKIAHRTVQDRLIAHLKAGRSAIHDATNLRNTFRQWRHEAARQTGCRVLLVQVQLDEAETRRRIVARAATGSSISDADLVVYKQLLATEEPIHTPHRIIHTDQRFHHDVRQTASHIERLLANGAPAKRKRKALAYITHGTQLLIFRQPTSPSAGIQVPGGTVETDEDWEAAILREATEETGLHGLTLHRYLGEVWRDYGDYGKNELHQRRFFHLHAPDRHADRWQHWEEFSGPNNNRHLFELFWVERDKVPLLIADHGYFLESL